VGVKAKTNEGMGLVGAGEGAAAFAVVLLVEGLASDDVTPTILTGTAL
jgi:hypothetical protein